MNVEAVSYYSDPAVCWDEGSGILDYRLTSLSRSTRQIRSTGALAVTDLAVVGHRVAGLAALPVFLLRLGRGR